MKRKIFRPGFFSLFMIALMMYLSYNKQNSTDVVPRPKISASGGNETHNESKWLKEAVMQANKKLKPLANK